MFAWQATVQDEFGNVVPLPVVTVWLEDGATLASIYNELGAPVANPFTGTIEGFVQFWANRGKYKLEGTKSGLDTEIWDWNAGDVGLDYGSRQSFVSDVAAGKVQVPNGTTAWADGYSYVRLIGSTVIPDILGWVPNGDITPYHFSSLVPQLSKSQADSSSDDWAPAIQLAVNYAESSRKSKISFRGGYHRCGATITASAQGVEFYGPSQNQSLIYLTHMSTGIRVKNRGFRFSGLSVLGNDARSFDLVTTPEQFNPDCCGIRFELDDVPLTSTNDRIRDLNLYDYSVRGNHVGLIFTGPITGHSLNAVVTLNGINVEWGKGKITNRVNQESVGTPIFTWTGGQVSNGKIHNFTIGYNDFTSSICGVRIVIQNVDGISGGGTTTISGLRSCPAQIWANGDELEFKHNVWGMDALDDAGQPVAAVGLAGADNRIISPRFLRAAAGLPAPIIFYGLDAGESTGLLIEGSGLITSTTPNAMVQVERHPLGNVAGTGPATRDPVYPLTIIGLSPREYVQPVSTGPIIGTDNFNRAGCFIGAIGCPNIILSSNVSATSSTTLADTNLKAWLETSTSYGFEAYVEYDGAAAAGMKINFSSPAGSTVNFGVFGAYTDAAGVMVNPVIGTGDITLQTAGAATFRQILIRGRVTTGAVNAGWITLRMAQNTSNATPSRIRSGSRFIIKR